MVKFSGDPERSSTTLRRGKDKSGVSKKKQSLRNGHWSVRVNKASGRITKEGSLGKIVEGKAGGLDYNTDQQTRSGPPG